MRTMTPTDPPNARLDLVVIGQSASGSKWSSALQPMKSGLKALARTAPWWSVHLLACHQSTHTTVNSALLDTSSRKGVSGSQPRGGLRRPGLGSACRVLPQLVQGLEKEFTDPSHLGAQSRMIVGSPSLCPIT
jgi:hypothetical protein